MTPPEAAAVLGLSEVWVRRLVRAGRIESEQRAGRVFIRPEAIDDFVERRQTRPPGPLLAVSADDWDSEAKVVATLVRHLRRHGWVVTQRANPATREHGIDLVVERAGVRRAIEVKGYPGAIHLTGARAGQPKRWRHTQARSYMGGLLLEAMLLAARMPEHEIAIAAPDRETFTTLAKELLGQLIRLGIGVYVIRASGQVEELAAPSPVRAHD